MKAKISARIQSALYRAGRTFAQSFLAIVVAAGTGWVHVDTLKTAAIAGGAAVLSLALRALDYTDLPTPPPG